MRGRWNRRVVLGGAVAAAGLGRVAMAQGTPTASPAANGPWSFTDDREVRIEADQRPETIVAMTYAAQTLHDFGVPIAGYFGPQSGGEGEFQVTGDLDFASLAYLGTGDPIDIEGLIALETDLIVSYSFPYEDQQQLWWLGATEASVASVAPTAGIAFFYQSLAQSVARFEELAAALGADVNTPERAAEREAFTETTALLQEAIGQRPDLTVAVVRATPEGIVVPASDAHSSLIYLRDQGMTFIGEDPARRDGDWYTYSMEELNLLSADVLLAFSLPELEAIGTWASLPAVQAGQVGKWGGGNAMSYRAVNPEMRAIADLVATAAKVV